MRVQTFSIVTGTEACNASCGFCVSKMTPANGVGPEPSPIRWERFRKACRFAQMMDVTTVMLTGKGEPTLFPDQITAYLRELVPFNFPFTELQTNGLKLADDDDPLVDTKLKLWESLGLTTIAISVVHYDPGMNSKVYYSHRPKKDYIDLPALIGKLHRYGYSVRLAAVMLDGWLDSADAVASMIAFAKSHGVEQLSLRPVKRPDATASDEVATWVSTRCLQPEALKEITTFVRERGTLLMTLQHGAEVFDVDGQNVCLTDCLTLPQGEDIRQAIFFPDGHLRYDWQYPGAILM